jgi:hypothetical protein
MMRLAPDGLPLRLDLTGRVGLPDGQPVLLPLGSGPETRVRTADLRLRYDAAQGDGWSGEARLTGLQRPDLAVARGGAARIGAHRAAGGGRLCSGCHADLWRHGRGPRRPRPCRGAGPGCDGRGQAVLAAGWRRSAAGQRRPAGGGLPRVAARADRGGCRPAFASPAIFRQRMTTCAVCRGWRGGPCRAGSRWMPRSRAARWGAMST